MPGRKTRSKPTKKRPIEQYGHGDKQRANNPHVGLVTPETDRDAGKRRYEYDPHLDPQLQWAGKAEHTSFEVPTVSLHVHERVDPKTILEAVRRRNGRGGHLGWQGGQKDVVHLVTRVSRAKELGRRCIFTDRNAATSYHTAFENLDSLGPAIDWQVMPLENWAGEAKEPRQAEFLVHDFVPWTAITGVVAMTPGTAQRVARALEGAAAPPVVVEPSWYYP